MEWRFSSYLGLDLLLDCGTEFTAAITSMPCPLGSSRSYQSSPRSHTMSTPTGARE